MNLYQVESDENRIVISIDKNLIDTNELINLLNRFRVEYLSKKADFQEDVVKIANDIKKIWWRDNKDQYLKADVQPVSNGNDI
jgi:hypothetical protein